MAVLSYRTAEAQLLRHAELSCTPTIAAVANACIRQSTTSQLIALHPPRLDTGGGDAQPQQHAASA